MNRSASSAWKTLTWRPYWPKLSTYLESRVSRFLLLLWLIGKKGENQSLSHGKHRTALFLLGSKGAAPSLLLAGALWMCSVAQGGILDKGLQSYLQASEPGDEVAVIITLAYKADLSKIRTLPELIRRKRLPQVLRSHAETSQAPLIHYLEERGGKSLHTIWVTNLLAATVPTELVPSIAERPDVAAIRLDNQIPLTRHPMAGEPNPDKKER